MQAWRVRAEDPLGSVMWEQFVGDEPAADLLADGYLDAGAYRVTFAWTDVPTRFAITGNRSHKHDDAGTFGFEDNAPDVWTFA